MVCRYDPVHWGVPEGSYATDPDGPARIVEFRTMVQVIDKSFQIIGWFYTSWFLFSCYYYMILIGQVVYSGHQQDGLAFGAGCRV